MKRKTTIIFSVLLFTTIAKAHHQHNDSTITASSYNLDEVVVTGSRVPIGQNIIPVPVSIVNRGVIERSEETNLMPVLMKHVPSLFVTSRGIAGYGVSGGSAGGINLRGFSGGAGRVLMLIDGHPQYATIYGHPVADAYIASEAQRVEVSRGSASILYGSNAMGGAINIITRKALEDGNRLSARLMGGSYGTQRYSVTDSYRNGRLSGVVSGNYERTDGHRADMGFESFSGYGKLGYEFSEEWKATGNVNVAKSKSQNPGTITTPLLDNKADDLSYSKNKQKVAADMVLAEDNTITSGTWKGGTWSFDEEKQILTANGVKLYLQREVDWDANPRTHTIVYAGYTTLKTYWGKKKNNQ